jgi:hypothetical protein
VNAVTSQMASSPLRSGDAKMVAQIDAVFVTAELNGGSHRPSGKSPLFADLCNDPNHP